MLRVTAAEELCRNGMITRLWGSVCVCVCATSHGLNYETTRVNKASLHLHHPHPGKWEIARLRIKFNSNEVLFKSEPV